MLRDLASNAGMSAAKAHPYLVSFTRLGPRRARQSQRSIRTGTPGTSAGACEHAHGSIRFAWRQKRSPSWPAGSAKPSRCPCGATTVRRWYASRESHGAVHVNMRTGSVMSLLGTATGRVFAAFLPSKMIEMFIEGGVGAPASATIPGSRCRRKQMEAAVSGSQAA